jgi:hypothetical protein
LKYEIYSTSTNTEANSKLGKHTTSAFPSTDKLDFKICWQLKLYDNLRRIGLNIVFINVLPYGAGPIDPTLFKKLEYSNISEV